MNTKVSVIMTTYNCLKYLEVSINSALRQSLRDIELICIDGDSSDGTSEYIKKRQEVDGRIKLYLQDGEGIGAAKNTGIKKANGEYITFLDADDMYVDDDALRIMYTKAKEKDAKICGALRTVLEMDGEISCEPLHRNDLKSSIEGLWLKYEDRQYDYHFHSYIYDREMIINSDARFAETCCYDDTHFFIRAALQAKRFYVVPVELYRYRAGTPYVWNDKQCTHALKSLLDQLEVTDANNLMMLHWVTMQRINYDYRENFVRSVKSGNLDVLELLLKCNGAINNEYIRRMEKTSFPEGYLDTMVHISREDLTVRYGNNGRVLLEPIWECLYKETIVKVESPVNVANNSEIVRLREKLEDDNRNIAHILNSTSYRIGRAITWLPRMIRKGFKALIA